jgi:hypothetical protein
MTHSNRPWRAVRTPPPFAVSTITAPKETSESGVRITTAESPPPEYYDVNISELDVVADRPLEERLLADGEKSTWDSRAMLALELSKLGAFSKADADAVIAEAERLGMSFTKDRSHVVVFDGQNFTLARNTVVTRAFFKLDSFLRRMAEPKGRP